MVVVGLFQVSVRQKRSKWWKSLRPDRAAEWNGWSMDRMLKLQIVKVEGPRLICRVVYSILLHTALFLHNLTCPKKLTVSNFPQKSSPTHTWPASLRVYPTHTWQQRIHNDRQNHASKTPKSVFKCVNSDSVFKCHCASILVLMDSERKRE